MVTYCFRRWCAMNRIAICLQSVQYDCELWFFTAVMRDLAYLSRFSRDEQIWMIFVIVTRAKNFTWLRDEGCRWGASFNTCIQLFLTSKVHDILDHCIVVKKGPKSVSWVMVIMNSCLQLCNWSYHWAEINSNKYEINGLSLSGNWTDHR